jgi:hypothetical protein
MTDNLPSAATTYRSAPSSVAKIGSWLAGTGRLPAGWKRLGFLLAFSCCGVLTSGAGGALSRLCCSA